MLDGMTQEIKGCRFLPEVLFKEADGLLPESLRGVLRDFAYAYMPRLHIVAFICRRGGGEVTITLMYDSDAVYDVCLSACARAARAWFSWVDAIDAVDDAIEAVVDAIDAVDVCRRECRTAADELVKQDVEAGVRMLRDLLKRAGITHKVEAKTDGGAVLRLRL
jgi:hypothetical protein